MARRDAVVFAFVVVFLAPQDPIDHGAHLVDAHAARALIAGIAAEQFAVRGIVHVDHELVGEVDLHGGQRILVAGILAEEIAVGGRVGPVHHGGIDFGSVDTIEDTDAELFEIARILQVMRDEVALDDRGGRLPIGVEGNIAHLAGQRGRRALQLSRHDVVARVDMTVLDGFELGRGNIHEDIALAQALRIRLHARQVFAQREQPGLGGDVEFGQRAVVDTAGDGNAMVDLEGLHRLHHLVVEDIGVVGIERIEGHVTLGHQALAQVRHVRSLGALEEFLALHHGPAAARHDFLIHGDGAGQGFTRSLRQNGRLALVGDDFGAGGELAGNGGLRRHRGDGTGVVLGQCVRSTGKTGQQSRHDRGIAETEMARTHDDFPRLADADHRRRFW